MVLFFFTILNEEQDE